jgi:hypothetical protein
MCPEVHMWVLALLVFAMVLIAGVWAGRRHATTDLPRAGAADRIAMRDPHDPPWGPHGTI